MHKIHPQKKYYTKKNLRKKIAQEIHPPKKLQTKKFTKKNSAQKNPLKKQCTKKSA